MVKAVSQLRVFVRRELGCGCPDEVFDSIEFLDPRPRFADLPGDYLIAIGHRLLILVIDTRAWRELVPCLEKLRTRGRAVRDALGFRRLRLVVVTPEIDVARPALVELFDTLTEGDDQVYLHVILPQSLPALGGGNGR